MQRSGHSSPGGQVPAAATRAGKGTGNAVKNAHGLPPYHLYQQKFTGGRAAAHGKNGVSNAKTSQFVASRSTAAVSWYKNADGSVTRRVYQSPVNYAVSKGVWAPIDTRLVSAPGGWVREKANLLLDNEDTLWPLKRVASDNQGACGPESHNCDGQMDNLGIEHN